MKISPEDKEKIKQRLKNGELQTDLAKEYNISQSYISKIAKQEPNFLRDRYKHQFDYTVNDIRNKLNTIITLLNKLESK